jgi:hypothetical protein
MIFHKSWSVAMNDVTLLRTLGVAAVVGGLLRVASAFIPWDGSDPRIEALAFVIDTALLFGLMGVYFAARERLGWFGFAAFALAVTGIASIIGPDSVAFGVDTYLAGVHAISIGLALLGVQMLLRRAGTAAAAVCWIASLAAGAGGGAIGHGELGFLLGGILFALGFVFAGLDLLRRATS